MFTTFHIVRENDKWHVLVDGIGAGYFETRSAALQFIGTWRFDASQAWRKRVNSSWTRCAACGLTFDLNSCDHAIATIGIICPDCE